MSFYRGSLTPGSNGRSFRDMSSDYERQAINTFSAQRPGETTTRELPGPTLGGGISAGMGGAAAGSAIGSAVVGAGEGSAGGWWGAAIGFIGGLAAYYLS